MNKKLISLIIFIVLIVVVGLSVFFINKNQSNKQTQNENQTSNNTSNDNKDNNKSTNILVAVFSKAGENYSVGNVEVGNTEMMANNIVNITGGTLYKIEPVTLYPDSYEEAKEVATKELQENARPKIKTEIENFDQYDTIFIGYPIWYGDCPMIINTFLENYDFTGKTIIPFNTHEGSGNSGTYIKIKNKLSSATVLEGLPIRGSDARKDFSINTIKSWINKLNL